ncbi:hypothetical protein ACLOJK_039241 [Asimina triloba]
MGCCWICELPGLSSTWKEDEVATSRPLLLSVAIVISVRSWDCRIYTVDQENGFSNLGLLLPMERRDCNSHATVVWFRSKLKMGALDLVVAYCNCRWRDTIIKMGLPKNGRWCALACGLNGFALPSSLSILWADLIIHLYIAEELVAGTMATGFEKDDGAP